METSGKGTTQVHPPKIDGIKAHDSWMVCWLSIWN